MNEMPVHAVSTQSGTYRYPCSHWDELQRFFVGTERDPKDSFCLAEDAWDAWPYAADGYPSNPSKYRFHFEHLRSFLKPYVKWYCYQRLLGKGRPVSCHDVSLPYRLTFADAYLIEHGCICLDDIATPSTFTALWNAHLSPLGEGSELRSEAAVKPQTQTRPFWMHLRVRFDAPRVIPPPVVPYKKRMPTEVAFDEQKLIPLPVERQLVNKLALHREGRARLNRFHHLRLCVLLLSFALGRRINELLTAPRGKGENGPLTRHPERSGSPKGALWFQFRPTKGGPQNQAYVSPEWEDLVTYCTHELLRYSDEVRSAASAQEQDLLILVSRWNQTAGNVASQLLPEQNLTDFTRNATSRGRRRCIKSAGALSYAAFRTWLSEHKQPQTGEKLPGILQQWNITADGKASGEVYQLQTHQARHTRQSALVSDPHVSRLTLQRDLNHTSRDMQLAYQHGLHEQNEVLLAKAHEGLLVGPAMVYLSTLLNVKAQRSEPSSQFQSGQPSWLTPRWRALLKNNPQFVQLNRVPCGLCALPQGPLACEEYMNCTEADDGGCNWFVIDPENEEMQRELEQRASGHRQREDESHRAGHVVQAHKFQMLAERTEAVQKTVRQHTSQQLLDRLRACKREIEEGNV